MSDELLPAVVDTFKRIAPMIDYLCAALDLEFRSAGASGRCTAAFRPTVRNRTVALKTHFGERAPRGAKPHSRHDASLCMKTII